MTVLESITQGLRQIGADGLCHTSTRCGCGLDDLAPCREWIGDCVPAKGISVAEALILGVKVEYEEDYPESVIYIPLNTIKGDQK